VSGHAPIFKAAATGTPHHPRRLPSPPHPARPSAAARERCALINVAEAQKQWRLSQAEVLELARASGAREITPRLRLVDAAAAAKARFGGDAAAFLDRSRCARGAAGMQDGGGGGVLRQLQHA
jgi:hypothetical protein